MITIWGLSWTTGLNNTPKKLYFMLFWPHHYLHLHVFCTFKDIIGMQKENCGPETSKLKCGKFSFCFLYVSHHLWRPQICFLVAKPKHAHSFEDGCHGSRCINTWYTQSDHKIRQAGNKKTKKWAQFKISYSEVKYRHLVTNNRNKLWDISFN